MKSRKFSSRMTISVIMIFLCIVANIYFIYSLFLLKGIETLIRIIVSLILILLNISLIFGFLSSIKKKNKSYIILSIVSVIFMLCLFIPGHYIIKTYKVVDNFTTDSLSYSSSLVTLKDNKADSLKDVSGKVGMLDEETNNVGYIIPNEVIENNKLDVEVKKYSSYVEIIEALYDEKIDYAFLPTNYVIMFSNYEGKDFSNLSNDTKIIYTKEQKEKKDESSSSLTEPFTILLMGVDSESEDIAGSAFNGDSLMLITFNPNTLNVTMLSIPRDSYVPIVCTANKVRSKITHAAWYGEDCMINSISNFTGVDIDYYVKINFKGLVKIVDLLGGIEVDVPYSFCEQDSNRSFGENTVYVEKGLQTLNGEQALAFSRNRHTWPSICGEAYSNYVSNDFVRGQNQQKVLTAILEKIKQNGNIQTIYNLLDAVSNSIETNMSTSEILSLYNIGKDVIKKSSKSSSITDLIGIQRLYLSGKDAYIMDALNNMNLYFYVLYNESIQEVSDAMKINLELKEATLTKEFDFDVDEQYESKLIGERYTGTTVSYTSGSKTEVVEDEVVQDVEEDNTNEKVTVPNFIGLTYNQASKAASALGLYINVVGNKNDKVISQDTKASTTVEKGVTIKLTFGDEDKKNTVLEEDVTDTSNTSNTDNEEETDNTVDSNIEE